MMKAKTCHELIQRQIGNRLAQPAVLELKVLQVLHLNSVGGTKPKEAERHRQSLKIVDAPSGRSV
jgi:hypothetical protein